MVKVRLVWGTYRGIFGGEGGGKEGSVALPVGGGEAMSWLLWLLTVIANHRSTPSICPSIGTPLVVAPLP